MFEQFPDYDVLAEQGAPAPETAEEPAAPVKKSRKRKKALEEQAARNYEDGYGVFVETKTKNRNFITVFFFPIVLLWLEFTLRFSCGEPLSFASVLYTLFFTMVNALVLTFICTLGGAVFNKILCNIFLAALTALYIVQIAVYGATDGFWTFTSPGFPPMDMFWNGVADKLLFVIIAAIPLAFSLTVGLIIVPFKRIRALAKISLVLAAVLFFLVASVAVTLNKDSKSPISSYRVYNSSNQLIDKQERFGLLTMHRLDLTNVILSGFGGEKSSTE